MSGCLELRRDELLRAQRVLQATEMSCILTVMDEYTHITVKWYIFNGGRAYLLKYSSCHMMVHACNLSTLETRQEDREFEANLR
jgi:hypothetical protein